MGENTRNHYYNVDLNKPLSKRYSGLLLASGDNNGDVFHFAISKDGVNLVENDSVTFTAYFIRGDDITVTPEVVKENGVVHVTLDDTCYRREGRFVLAVKSTLSGKTTTIAIVDGYIRQTDSGNYIADEEQTITLDKIKGMANDMALFYEQAKGKMEELSGATENLENALEEAETITEKLPYIGDNGNWMQWDDDAGKFIDSGSPSRGIPGVNGTTPVKGKDYFDGEPGYTPQKGIDYFDGTSVTITNVSQSTADGGTNVVTFSDGKTLSIKNGSKGSQGADGKMTFEDLTEEQKESLRGPQGIQGPAGVDGRTPVAGVDYYTAADKQDIVNDALSALAGADPSDAGYAELKNRTSVLEQKFRNIAADVETIQQEVDELWMNFAEYIFKIVMRLVQLERHLGLQPPVSDDIDTNIGMENSYDDLFGQT